MALEPGTRFGSCEVVEPIGSGGMGEVYRATDTRLKRDIALKVLPPAFAEDADRLARLQREAEILASLNHPNIAQIYGLEQSAGRTAIVMELVDGRTLEDRIKDGPIPPDEAMGIALQVASALEAAHEKRIVHRDLKPANVKLRDDGTVKVLDFGISKPIDPKTISGGAPVATTPAVTETGVILGTAAYMSPEQARGKFVDERTDIWAFGCLLFEMLTGQPAFGGEDVMMTLARVLDRDTDLSSVPETISPTVRQTIRLCLEKEPRKRISDIRDVRLALEGRFWPEQLPAAAKRRPLPLALTLLLAVTAGAAAVTAYLIGPAPQEGPVVRSVIATDPGTAVPGGDISLVRDIAISPDGTRVVYGGGALAGPLFVQSLDRLGSEPLRGTEGGSSPVFSPDGREIAFFVQSEGALKRIAVLGGPVRVIATVDGLPTGLSWGPDGTIVFATDRSGGLLRVSSAGGEPEQLTTVDAGQGESEHRWPSMLRNGRGVLFTAWRETAEASTLAVRSFDTDDVTYLPLNGTHAIHTPTEHLLYASSNALRAVAFDARRLALAADASAPVAERLKTQSTGAAQFDVADSGSLVYVRESAGEPAENTLVWVDRSGREEPISLLPRPYGHVSISPSGDRIATEIHHPWRGPTIWVSDRGLTRLNQLPEPSDSSGFGSWFPLWSHDGRRVVFQSGSSNLFSASADGGGDAEPLLTVPGWTIVAPGSWTPDGTSLVFHYGVSEQLRTGLLDSDTIEWRPLIDRGNASNAVLAPDGDWLAYQVAVADRVEVWIAPYPALGDRRLVSGEAGGGNPLWAPNGRELYYVRPDRAMMAVPIATTPDLNIGSPEFLFMTDSYLVGPAATTFWDVAADGRFLMIKGRPPWGTARLDIIHVQNWFQELQRLVPLP